MGFRTFVKDLGLTVGQDAYSVYTVLKHSLTKDAARCWDDIRSCGTENDLPGLQHDCPEFRGMAAKLSCLAEDVYHVGETGYEMHPEVRDAVLVRKHIPDPDSKVPVQYAIWQVPGLGTVVAFRGTKTWRDLYIDLKIKPTQLADSGPGEDIRVHRGFHQGASKHAQEIAATVREVQAKSQDQRLFITGHSLGGAYSKTLMLLMLADEGMHAVLEGGATVVTFGAPSVLYAKQDEAGAIYDAVRTLRDTATLQRGYPEPKFCNIVNSVDIVPRLLGPCLGPIKSLMAGFWDIRRKLSLENRTGHLTDVATDVKTHAHHYQPLGTFYLIVEDKLRKVDSSTNPGLGDADTITRQLRMSSMLKVYVKRTQWGEADTWTDMIKLLVKSVKSKGTTLISFAQMHKMNLYRDVLVRPARSSR